MSDGLIYEKNNELCTKFAVPSFSHCVNIEVEYQNLGELP